MIWTARATTPANLAQVGLMQADIIMFISDSKTPAQLGSYELYANTYLCGLLVQT